MSPVASRITGRRQRIGLRALTFVGLLGAAIAVVAPDPLGHAAGVLAVAVVGGTPLLRVVWLIFRWWQERDYRFVIVGLALLGVIAGGSYVAWS